MDFFLKVFLDFCESGLKKVLSISEIFREVVISVKYLTTCEIKCENSEK